MDNFNLSIEFDFHTDFTITENQIIKELLAETPTGLGSQEHSPFFDYGFCMDTTANNALEPRNQFVPFNETNSHQVLAAEDALVNQNDNFDWTAFLEESPATDNSTEPIVVDESSNDSYFDADSVNCDNGFVYEELKTLDVAQMYSNLEDTFGLTQFNEMFEHMDYSVLADSKSHSNGVASNGSDMIFSKQKVFLVPFGMNATATESLDRVAKQLEKYPWVQKSMLHRSNGFQKSNEILLPKPPKQTKKKSEKYLTVDEQLERIDTKEIILPMISWNKSPRKRKQTPKCDGAKVPIEIVLANDENQPKKGSPSAKKTPPKAKSSKRQTKQPFGEAKQSIHAMTKQ